MNHTHGNNRVEDDKPVLIDHLNRDHHNINAGFADDLRYLQQLHKVAHKTGCTCGFYGVNQNCPLHGRCDKTIVWKDRKQLQCGSTVSHTDQHAAVADSGAVVRWTSTTRDITVYCTAILKAAGKERQCSLPDGHSDPWHRDVDGVTWHPSTDAPCEHTWTLPNTGQTMRCKLKAGHAGDCAAQFRTKSPAGRVPKKKPKPNHFLLGPGTLSIAAIDPATTGSTEWVTVGQVVDAGNFKVEPL